MDCAFGDHLILGLQGPSLSDDERQLLREIKPVGIILFSRSFERSLPYQGWLEKLRALLSEVRACTGRDKLFVSIDHEGSQWVRTPEPITRFPVARLYGKRARAIGAATGKELRSLGVNVSWAPVCDVNSNPANPIIGPRAFGTTAQEAGERAAEYLYGLHEAGILGCAKHFPGHGDTSTDSHKELPVVTVTPDLARQREFAAFLPCLRGDVPFVMTAHVLFPEFDQQVPATLSSILLKNILREELGFDGVVVSDDLEMKAVFKDFKKQGTLGKAIAAGCDLFIVSRFFEPGLDFTRFLAGEFMRARSAKEVPESALEKSRTRISAALSRCHQELPVQLSSETLLRHAELSLTTASGV